ncbi:MAG: hypothetical protein ACLSGB_16165 [Dorea sp.]
MKKFIDLTKKESGNDSKMSAKTIPGKHMAIGEASCGGHEDAFPHGKGDCRIRN